MAKKFLTPKSLAARWEMTSKTLAQWRWSGRGPHHHKFEGAIRYYLEDIELFEEKAHRQNTCEITTTQPREKEGNLK